MSTNTGNDMMSSAYTGLSDLGQFRADLGLIFSLVAALVLIVIGIYFLIYNDDDNYIRASGTVVEPVCTQETSTQQTSNGNHYNTTVYKCNLTVSYTINGAQYKSTFYTSGNSGYIKGQPVDLMVTKTDYNQAKLATMSSSTIASIMFCIAFSLVGLSYLNYYMTHQYKIYAAGQGASSIVGLFRQ